MAYTREDWLAELAQCKTGDDLRRVGMKIPQREGLTDEMIIEMEEMDRILDEAWLREKGHRLFPEDYWHRSASTTATKTTSVPLESGILTEKT